MATTKKRNTKQKPQNNTEMSWRKEALLVGIIAIFVLLFISNFGFGGRVGNVISSFFFGIVGIVAYVLPIVFIWLLLFIISNKENKIAWLKGLAAILAVVFFTTLIEVALHSDQPVTLVQAFQNGFERKEGGGMIGAAFSGLFLMAFGVIGSYVVSIAGILISALLVTEKALFSLLSKKSKQVRTEQMANREEKIQKKEQRQLEREQEREQERLRRMDQKVSGVALDTKIGQRKSGPSVDEMAEINFSGNVIFDESDETLDLKQIQNIESTMSKSKPSVSDKTIVTEVTQTKPVPVVPAEPVEPVIVEEKEEELAIVMNTACKQPDDHYSFPPVRLLKKGSGNKQGESSKTLKDTAAKLEQTLKNFGVNVTITDVSCGPSVTRYELQPEQGVKVSKIVSLADDIKLNLAAADVRIEAPIPGKAAVGIEVPNKENVTVMLRDLIESDAFANHKSKIAFPAGKDIGGNVIVSDIGKMPHVLIAGATGSGKSVCINTIIMSILYKAKPSEVKLIMIDPKVVELSVYNGIPHLMIPVVTDPKKAAGALHWAVAEMTDRYQKFAQANVRDLAGYNDKIQKNLDQGIIPADGKMPQIVIIVDELADLMMVAPGDVEDAICRLAQLARAAGIHLILATQRPSVNVITGLIKANMPSRVAFAVSSGVDSRTILDMNGAEKLLGKGDMLFYPQGYQKPLRVQGAFVSDEEVANVVQFLTQQNPETTYNPEIEQKMNGITIGKSTSITIGTDETEDDRDRYFEEAGRLLIEKERGSIGMLQRVFKIGFNRAARIMDQLQEAGVVGPEEGTKPRKILLTMEEFQELIEQNR
ncbi:MAG: DNA translocase FtsK [Lachnospiraceae bacterium]|nr:DNA translocase FtsK [Lachnospiraceae bacterium]